MSPGTVLVLETAIWCTEEMLHAHFSVCHIGYEKDKHGDLGFNEISNYCFIMEALKQI